MKNFIKKAFNLLGLEIRKTTFSNALKAQQRLVNDNHAKLIIFDVGAYDGSTAYHYRQAFPQAAIHSFEPFPAAFSTLGSYAAKDGAIHAHNIGLSDSSGKATFYTNSFAPTNSLLKTHPDGEATWGNTNVLIPKEEIEVNITTLDAFVAQEKIDCIDILKIDVQGAEHKVISGASETLKQGKVGMIYTEIITMPTYQNQKSMEEVIAQLKEYGFELFNLYNYSRTDYGQLRQVDALFVNTKMYSLNPKKG